MLLFADEGSMLSSVKQTKSNKTEPLVSVGIPRDLHREMTEYVQPRGMKMRSLPAVLWSGFKLLSPEQLKEAQDRAGQYLARRHPRQKQPA